MDEFDSELVDEVLAEDFLNDSYADDAYDRWRDDQCDMLYDDLKAVVDGHVNSKKRGYYKDRPDKFLEDTVEMLKHFTNCELTTLGENIITAKKRNVTVEFVEDKNEVPATSKPIVGS